MKRWRCVIFDCDGVLVDSVPISNHVLLEMLTPYGAPEQFEQPLKNFQSGSLKVCFQEIEKIIRQPLPESFEKEFRHRTFEAFRLLLKPVEGIQELLGGLTIPYCVASSGPPEKIRHNLGITNLLEKFEGKIFSSYDIRSWKPAPDLFLHAAEKMKVQAHECVVVEDSLEGIQAAKAGGFDVFGFAQEHNSSLFKNAGAMVFHSMKELSFTLL